MATHPYISGAGNITQMIGFLRKSFPATVSSDTVKKLGLASKNESYVINVLQFLGLIDEEGKRTDEGHAALTRHDEAEFKSLFGDLVRKAYSDLFELRGDAAWQMNKDKLIGYFRSADKTSDIIGSRQAGVFMALRELAGYTNGEAPAAKARPNNAPKKAVPKRPRPVPSTMSEEVVMEETPTILKQQKGDVALTVRIEINLPAEGTQETYDAIFKSIRANLFP